MTREEMLIFLFSGPLIVVCTIGLVLYYIFRKRNGNDDE